MIPNLNTLPADSFTLRQIRFNDNSNNYSFKVEVCETTTGSSIYINFYFPKSLIFCRVFQVHFPKVDWKENPLVKLVVNYLEDKKNKILKEQFDKYFFKFDLSTIENNNITLYNLYKDYIPLFDSSNQILNEKIVDNIDLFSECKEIVKDVKKDIVIEDSINNNLFTSPILIDEINKGIVVNKIFLKDNSFFIYNVKNKKEKKLKEEDINTDLWVYKDNKGKIDLAIVRYINNNDLLLTMSKMNSDKKELQGKLINKFWEFYETSLQPFISKIRIFDLNGETFALIIKDTKKEISSMEIISLKDFKFKELNKFLVDSNKTNIFNKLKDDNSILKILNKENKESDYLKEVYWIIEIESKEYLYLNYFSKDSDENILFLTDWDTIQKTFPWYTLINRLTNLVENSNSEFIEVQSKVWPTVKFNNKEFLILENSKTLKNLIIDSKLEKKEEFEKEIDKVLEIITFDNYKEDAILTLEKDLKLNKFKFSVIDKNWFEIIDKSSIYPKKITFWTSEVIHCEDNWLHFLRDAYWNNLIFEYGVEEIVGIVFNNNNLKYVKYKEWDNYYYIDENLNVLTEKEYKSFEFDWDSSYVKEDKETWFLKLLDGNWKEAPLLKNKQINWIKKIWIDLIIIGEPLKNYNLEIPEYYSKSKFSLFSKDDLCFNEKEDLFGNNVFVVNISEQELNLKTVNPWNQIYLAERPFLGFAYIKKEELKKFNNEINVVAQVEPNITQNKARVYKGLISLTNYQILKLGVQFISKPYLQTFSTIQGEEKKQKNWFWTQNSYFDKVSDFHLELNPYDTYSKKIVYCQYDSDSNEFKLISIFKDKDIIRGSPIEKYEWVERNDWIYNIEELNLYVFVEVNGDNEKNVYISTQRNNMTSLKKIPELTNLTEINFFTTSLETEQKTFSDKLFIIYKKDNLEYFSVLKIVNKEIKLLTPELFKNWVHEILKEVINEKNWSKLIKFKETERSSYSSVKLKHSPNKE